MGWAACQPDKSVPAQHRYVQTVPANFPPPAYTFSNNPPSKEGFELGRRLFYDPMLSIDGTIACGNCHKQASAFADTDHRVSHGVDNQNGTRNSPPIFNAAWQRNFFWDGGVLNLETLPLAPITNPVEQGETIGGVVRKLNADATYPARFKAVFGKDSVDSQQLLWALAQFTGLMQSANSRYDKHVRNEGETLTPIEQQGLAIFRQKCASCHATDLFTDGAFRNNGLDANHARDAGREIITELPEDRGKFRVPTLRNVELTAPYMHDGRFKTLPAVLDYYQSGVQDSPTLDPLLKSGGSLGIPLTDDEKTSLLAFLLTLTDREFVTDPRFSEPAF